ncbi:hypothetical protein HGP28_14955 [Vibrio sp. SM6]|uniref:Integrase n=1 Tax=Vibrio agarilyticus TaxID=2726741 RepID=A0A7X8TTV2_9VIBR|nr:hypothetical protein [Vibrio agarilyticus]NLS14188.1 hypothetical protein [Vibrio agarilyticus]
MSHSLEQNINTLLVNAPQEIIDAWQSIAVYIECPDNLRSLKLAVHALESCARFKPNNFERTFNLEAGISNALFSPFSSINSSEFPDYSNKTLAKGSKTERPIYALLHQLNDIVDRYLANTLLVFLDHYFTNEAAIKKFNRDYQIFSSIRLLYTDINFDRSYLSESIPNDIALHLTQYKEELLLLDNNEPKRQMLPHIRELTHFYQLDWKTRAARCRKSSKTIRSAYRKIKPERIIGSRALSTYPLKQNSASFHESHTENGATFYEDYPALHVVDLAPSETRKPSHELPDYSLLHDQTKEKAKARSIQHAVNQSHNITCLARTILQPHELSYLWQELLSNRRGEVNKIDKHKVRFVITVCLMFARELDSALQLQYSSLQTGVDDGFWHTKHKTTLVTSVTPTARRTKFKESPDLLKTDGNISLVLPESFHQQLQACQFHSGTLKDNLGGIKQVRKAIDQLLATLNQKHGCQISLKRIENHLKNDITAREQFDPVLLEPLSGTQNYFTRSPRHYAWYQCDELASQLTSLWQKSLHKKFDVLETMTLCFDESQPGFGSEFTPSFEALKRLVSLLTSDINRWSAFDACKTLDAAISYHNAYTLYTVYLLFIATGYRAVSNPLPSFSFALMRYNAICISDKDSAITFAHMRVIACPTLLKTQLTFYQHHLDAFARLLAHNFPFEAGQLLWHRSHQRFIELTSKNARLDWHESAKNSQKNDGLFLLFEKNEDGTYRTTNTYPASIMAMSGHLPDLPLNFGRHYLRRYLQRAEVDQELIKFQMGHWVTGENPLERHSSLCMQDAVATLLPILDEMLDEMNWQSIPSALTRMRL